MVIDQEDLDRQTEFFDRAEHGEKYRRAASRSNRRAHRRTTGAKR